VFGQSTPTVIGWAVSLAAPLALLGVDAIDKRYRSRSRTILRV
jgi:hypothetical protein